VRFDFLMVLKIWIMILCVVTPCSLVCGYQCFGGMYGLHLLIWLPTFHYYPEYGDDRFIWNTGIRLQDYMASQSRGPQSKTVVMHQILYDISEMLILLQAWSVETEYNSTRATYPKHFTVWWIKFQDRNNYILWLSLNWYLNRIKNKSVLKYLT
jgi:hypothetical protein